MENEWKIFFLKIYLLLGLHGEFQEIKWASENQEQIFPESKYSQEFRFLGIKR